GICQARNRTDSHQIASTVHYISLSRNFGHQNALKAGLDHCSGDVVISMDGDLQHPPGLIPEMIEKWQAGYDIVVTTRRDAEAGNFLKRFTSRNFYRLMSSFSNIELKPGSADFRLLDRTVVDVLKTFEETDIFYRGYVAWSGFKQFEIPYIPEKRQAGTTKYTPRKMIRLALDGLLGFSILPLRLVTMIGVVISMASFLYGFYAICIRLFSDTAVSGWASTMAGIYFLGGIQLLCIGICGEYIGRTFMEVKRRPHYIIAKTSIDSEDYSF
ncbi:glycosyltransferase family 2 protein, partial [Thermodesulfobacteriota bacterium]